MAAVSSFEKLNDPSPVKSVASAGIGGKCEELPTLGAFVSMTGGSLMDRRFSRVYLKDAGVDTKPDVDADLTTNSLKQIIMTA